MRSALKIVSLLSRATGTPIGFRAVKLIRELNKSTSPKGGRQYAKALVSLRTPPPSAYREPDLYLREQQVVGLVKKLAGLDTGIDLHQEAVNTFYECEVKNRDTNARLGHMVNWIERGFSGDHHDLRLYEFIQSVRQIVGDLLGPLPTCLIPKFSGGSTFYDKGEKITIPHKLSSTFASTQNAVGIWEPFLFETHWGKTRGGRWTTQVVEGNRFTSVPKDSTKNRGICIEPLMNIVFQLPVGDYMRSRYKTYAGVEIDGKGRRNAQRVHRQLARYASFTGELATIDLSNASDLVSIALVKLCLPKGWFDLLNALRSPSTFIEGKWVKNSKFSSMGNGFTFELESILFYSIARAVCGWASAYGDDIICPSGKAGDLVACLGLLGLTVNQSKSFTHPTDPFRESCGGDFFKGTSVRPFFLKSEPSNPLAWIELHNQIVTLAERSLVSGPWVTDALKVCVSQIPFRYRKWGPNGDVGVLWTDREEFYEIKHHKYEGCPNGLVSIRRVETVRRKIKLSKFDQDIQLTAALLSCPSSGVIPRDSVSGYRTVWRPFFKVTTEGRRVE